MALLLLGFLPAVAALADAPAAATFSAAVREGAAVYAYNCSVCHGPAGGGLAEARLAFPPGERHCSRCHKPNNPVVWPLSRPIVDNDMFSIGTPPALHAGGGGGTLPLAASASPETLFAYLRATMPRYHPGRQSDVEYWLLTVFLLQMNERGTEAQAAAASATAAGWSAAAP